MPFDNDAPETDETELESVEDAPKLGDPEGSEPDPDNPEGEEEEGEGNEAEGEFEELELDNGVKVWVSKEAAEEARNGWLRQKDYTQKTQDVAEQRKALEERQQAIDEDIQTRLEHINDIVTIEQAETNIKELDARIQQFNQIDWTRWFDQNPQKAQAGRIQYDQVREARQRAVETRDRTAANLHNKHNERQQKAKEAREKAVAEGRAAVARNIKGWNDDVERAVVAYGTSLGFDEQAIRDNFSDPRIITLLHKAYVGDQLLKKQNAPKSKPGTKPMPRLKGRGAPSGKPSDRQSTADWIKARNKELASKAG